MAGVSAPGVVLSNVHSRQELGGVSSSWVAFTFRIVSAHEETGCCRGGLGVQPPQQEAKVGART